MAIVFVVAGRAEAMLFNSEKSLKFISPTYSMASSTVTSLQWPLVFRGVSFDFHLCPGDSVSPSSLAIWTMANRKGFCVKRSVEFSTQ